MGRSEGYLGLNQEAVGEGGKGRISKTRKLIPLESVRNFGISSGGKRSVAVEVGHLTVDGSSVGRVWHYSTLYSHNDRITDAGESKEEHCGKPVSCHAFEVGSADKQHARAPGESSSARRR